MRFLRGRWACDISRVASDGGTVSVVGDGRLRCASERLKVCPLLPNGVSLARAKVASSLRARVLLEMRRPSFHSARAADYHRTVHLALDGQETMSKPPVHWQHILTGEGNHGGSPYFYPVTKAPSFGERGLLVH